MNHPMRFMKLIWYMVEIIKVKLFMYIYYYINVDFILFIKFNDNYLEFSKKIII